MKTSDIKTFLKDSVNPLGTFKFIILSLVTLGIYPAHWLLNLTRSLNALYKSINSASELSENFAKAVLALAYLFLPLYFIDLGSEGLNTFVTFA
ncbi:MAG: DUF4234 domain-containing protein, partial [Bacteriovoracaceae bacterium]